MRHIISLALLSLLTPCQLLAESGPLGFGPKIMTQDMETDRPDITEGTQTVTKGHFQIESGYTFVYDDKNSNTTRSHTLPEFLLRIGLLEELELRLAWEGYSNSSFDSAEGNSHTDGLTDTSIGIKHKMYEETPLNPSLSFIFDTTLPTGSSDFGSDELQPSFKLLWAYGFKNSAAVAGNINFDFPVENSQRYFSQGVSLTLSYAPDALGYYVEYFGEFPSSEAPDSSASHLANGGLTYAVSANLQLDVRIGLGLSNQAPDFFTGVGFAFRR